MKIVLGNVAAPPPPLLTPYSPLWTPASKTTLFSSFKALATMPISDSHYLQILFNLASSSFHSLALFLVSSILAVTMCFRIRSLRILSVRPTTFIYANL
jgi:hypothetical protein